jgi:hypothetical protein
VFAHSPTLLGCALWGGASTDDVRELLGAAAFGLRPGMTRYRWLVDMRGLRSISPRGGALLVAHVRTHREALGRNIIQQAHLPAGGVLGIVLQGLGLVTDLPFPARVFGGENEAFEWLGLPAGEGRELVQELEALRERSPESSKKGIARVDPAVLRSSRG